MTGVMITSEKQIGYQLRHKTDKMVMDRLWSQHKTLNILPLDCTPVSLPLVGEPNSKIYIMEEGKHQSLSNANMNDADVTRNHEISIQIPCKANEIRPHITNLQSCL